MRNALRTARGLLSAVAMGAATWIGVRLGQELADPYSDVRLRLAEVVDRMKEVRK